MLECNKNYVTLAQLYAKKFKENDISIRNWEKG